MFGCKVHIKMLGMFYLHRNSQTIEKGEDEAQFKKKKQGPFRKRVCPEPAEMFRCVSCSPTLPVFSLHSQCLVHISSVTLGKVWNDPVPQFPDL